MFVNIWDKVAQFVRDWGSNALVVGLIVGVLLTKFLPWILMSFSRFIAWLLAIIQGRGVHWAFEKDYLDWLIGQHRHLGLLPAQVVIGRWGERQKYVDLEDVYLELSVSSKSGDENLTGMYEEDKRSLIKQPFQHLERLIKPDEKATQGDLNLLINEHQRLVIRGDPGSGKTTLLRYLAVTHSRALRGNKVERDSTHIVKERLHLKKRLFPILVTLRRHGKVVSWGEIKELTDTFIEEMPPELRKRCPKGFFEQHLRRGNCLILLDALDELGSPEARTAMARRIAALLQIYDHPDNRIIVTTRIIGYEGQLDQYEFNVRTVQKLQAGQIRALVKQRYKAIAISETIGRQKEARTLQQNLLRRSERLIEKIESTPRLNELATNPLILSLIVLVHFLKVELPEERVLLYRDCVEILTERWQQVKREEAEIQREVPEELTLVQKLILLREIAFAMQQRRKEESNSVLMPRDAVQDLITKKLPDFVEGDLRQSESARQEFYHRKAGEWIQGIQVESGILVEQGLDEAGEPLLGFSHLTFQEYLAAVAINEVHEYESFLWSNLLNPTWREVVLTYVVIISDATPLISALLESPLQPDGILLAGHCLTQRVRHVKPTIQQTTLTKLKNGFTEADDLTVGDFGKVMAAIGGSEIIAFLRGQFIDPNPARRLTAIEVLGQTKGDDSELETVRADLLRIVETPNEVTLTVTARKSLAQVGDPRFIGLEPFLVRVQSPRILQPSLSRKYRRLLNNEFEIGKYPITNLEYSRFVEATGYKAPAYWIEQTFPVEEATNPVVGVTPKDAVAYCKWLSRQSGKHYRLPKSYEWEWAASGSAQCAYPWGDEFDKDKCNTKESGLGRSTPVGSYFVGNSSFGITDMSGNVNEIMAINVEDYSIVILIDFLFFFAAPLVILLFIEFILYLFNINYSYFINIAIAILIFLYSYFLDRKDGWIGHHIRGGSFKSTASESTCTYNTIVYGLKDDIGFRCLCIVNK